MAVSPSFEAELLDKLDPQIGQELIQVTYDDGRIEQLRLHDYARVYEIEGLYERIVQDRLGCRSPNQLASMLGDAFDTLGWDRGDARVIDLAAGNGVSGEALRDHGLRPVLWTDIVPEARTAARRDRPDVYELYLTLDLLSLTVAQQETIRALKANAIACVAPVGTALQQQQLPPKALAAAARLLQDDALVVYMHDPMFASSDSITQQFWTDELGPQSTAELLHRTRYLHRRTVTGRPYEMEAVVWRLRRRGQAE